MTQNAKFHPDSRHPAMEVAGVPVFVYVTPDGLRVSIDLDAADPSLLLPTATFRRRSPYKAIRFRGTDVTNEAPPTLPAVWTRSPSMAGVSLGQQAEATRDVSWAVFHNG